MIYHGDALKYIESTPDVLEAILRDYKDILAESIALLHRQIVTEIYLAGSGSSYNAAVAAAPFLRKLLGVRVFPVHPSAFLEEIEALPKNSVLLGISQQGTSLSVMQALDAAKDRGIWTISVTGEHDTEIIRHALANLYVECGVEDAGATTLGYTSTVLTLILFALELAKEKDVISKKEYLHNQKRIHAVVWNMKAVIGTYRGWCLRVAKMLKDSKEMIIISGEKQRSSLLEAVLKFSESCRFPVRGYEADEFIHGMYNAVTDDTDFLYLFPEDKETREKMEKLYFYYEQNGNRQFALNRQDAGDFNIFLKDVDFSMLEQILPQQMLFVLTSRERGIDLNIPKDPDFHKKMGSKIEEKEEEKNREKENGHMEEKKTFRAIGVGFSCVDVYEKLGKYYPTGNGVDWAVHLQRMGVKTSILSVVGTDSYGDKMKEALQKEGIDISHLHTAEGETCKMMMDLKNGVDRVHLEEIEGVMKDFALTKEDKDYIRQYPYMHTDLFGNVLGDLKELHDAGVKVVMDFSCFSEDSEYCKDEYFSYVDYAFLSYEQEDDHIIEHLKKIKSYGPQIVTATFGEHGSLSYDGEKFYRHGIVVTDVVNTVGAGDSYIAGFTYGIMNGWDIPACMKKGAEVSAGVVSKFEPY